MKMEHEFYESLLRGLSGLAYRVYGGVKVALLTTKANSSVRTVVYDAPSIVINDLDEASKKGARGVLQGIQPY